MLDAWVSIVDDLLCYHMRYPDWTPVERQMSSCPPDFVSKWPTQCSIRLWGRLIPFSFITIYSEITAPFGPRWKLYKLIKWKIYNNNHNYFQLITSILFHRFPERRQRGSFLGLTAKFIPNFRSTKCKSLLLSTCFHGSHLIISRTVGHFSQGLIRGTIDTIPDHSSYTTLQFLKPN